MVGIWILSLARIGRVLSFTLPFLLVLLTKIHPSTFNPNTPILLLTKKCHPHTPSRIHIHTQRNTNTCFGNSFLLSNDTFSFSKWHNLVNSLNSFIHISICSHRSWLDCKSHRASPLKYVSGSYVEILSNRF